MTAKASELSPNGRWVTARIYAEIHGLHKQTLYNWSHRDRKAGRTEAAPGRPIYRKFGEAVRWWLPAATPTEPTRPPAAAPAPGPAAAA